MVGNQDVKTSARAAHEIDHGRMLARMDTEAVWGWGTLAGRQRAVRRAKLVASGAGLHAGMTALEIGCGTGLFTEMFARLGSRIVAVDISQDLIAKARARNLPENQVRFLVKRFEECDVDGPFDAVIGSSVLHHLDLPVALVKIYNLLRPGGRLSFAEPNMLNPQVFLERKFCFIRSLFWYVSPDETAFVRWSLEKKMQQAGFSGTRIVPFDWLHPAVPRSLINVTRQVGSLFEKIPGLKEFAGSLLIQGQKL